MTGALLRKTYVADETTGNTANVDTSGSLQTSTYITDAVSGDTASVDAEGQLHVVAEGKVDTNNSYSTPLGIGAVFTGTATETLKYAVIIVSVYSDVASATDGLEVEFSPDGTNWDICDEYTIPAATGKTFSFQPNSRYYRVKYTNGAVGQTAFRLQAQLKKTYVKPSSHRIQDPITTDDDAELVKAVLTGESSLDGTFENIDTYRGALNVNPAWVHRKIINETFHLHTATSTKLSSAASEGDTSLAVVSSAGFVAGVSNVKLEEGPTQEAGIMSVTNVVANTLTIDRPLANDYTTAADAIAVDPALNVVGTLAAPISFEIDPPPDTVWQITRILFSITDNVAMDDAKFGGLTALTNGVVLRAITAAGRTVVFGNWKSNADMKLDMYDVDYSIKAPAGFYGINGRWTFTKSGVVAELEGGATPVQKLEVLIQDDLSGLTSFTMRAQGRVFSP